MNKILELFKEREKNKFKNILGNYVKDEEEIRNERIYIRVTKEEKEIIAFLAKNRHQSKSDFIRTLVFVKYLNDFIKIG